MITIKEIVVKSILSKYNSMNIYRGCTHGCIYCDSRSECYGKTYTFEDIEVKANGLELLELKLKSKKDKVVITTGSMCDPYMPIEEQLQYTRKSLELIDKYGFGAAVLTKSNLVLRDLAIFKRINEKTKCVVQMTLTTYDEAICKIIEPKVCTTKERFEALKKLNEAQIPTIVWMTPLLPFINDTIENIDGLLQYCKEANVKGIITFGCGMTLRYGNREYYYQKLDEHFPGLKLEYMRRFGSRYGIGSPNSRMLNKRIKDFCKKHNMLFGEKECFQYVQSLPKKIEQISIFE